MEGELERTDTNCDLSAYTTYAFFEWSLILYDVAFDAVTALDFQAFELAIVDVTGGHAGAVPITKEGYDV